MAFSMNNYINKSTSWNKLDTSYTVSTGISYVINQSFQIAPSFNYSFGNGENFSFGASLTYIGGW